MNYFKNLSVEFADKFRVNKEEAIRWAISKGYPLKTISQDGTVTELQGFLNGRPLYNSTFNRIAAQTTSTDDVTAFLENFPITVCSIWRSVKKLQMILK